MPSEADYRFWSELDPSVRTHPGPARTALLSSPSVAVSETADFVDTGNPAIGIDCPNCGLLTARFGWFCRNCGFRLWPNAQTAARAFRLWRLADPARAYVHQFDDTSEEAPEEVVYVDFQQRAHTLGIHLFPSSTWPIMICIGVFFGALGFAPFPAPVRIVCGVLFVIFFFGGIAGWLTEDVRMFPADDAAAEHGHH